MQALVAVTQSQLFPLTYLIPETMLLEKGQIVYVPYRNKQKLGIVLDIFESSQITKLKFIASKIDYVLSEEMLLLMKKTAEYYLAEMGSIAKLILPLDKITQPDTPYIQEFNNMRLASLSSEQQEAFDKIKSTNVTVLNAVTGSGKTEIYFHLILKQIQSNKQSLLMLPEIALSKQITQRFKERFGTDAVIWNSSVSISKKQKIFQSIINGDIKVVIGTRSALFLPYKNLGQIIIDEEHDSSYKQDDNVPYNARDMAILRGHIENISVLLGTATPSLETYFNIINGKYTEIKIHSRFGDALMPDLHTIDMKKHKKNLWISKELESAISLKLEAKEQVMLFLNRTGYAPLMLCKNCGYRVNCSSCSTALVYHKTNNRLICHHCGYSQNLVQDCTECQNENSMIPCGPGVERIYEEITALFPDAVIQIMTRKEMDSHKKAINIIDKIMAGKVDIIIGTQIITKGYHFPKLTFVGVIDTDLGLLGGDLRAAEKTFQLLYQVGGRAGRESTKGSIYLQTYNPESILIQFLKDHDYKSFLEYEIANRKAANMPPVTRIASLMLSGKNEIFVKNMIKDIVNLMPPSTRVTIFGPTPAVISKLNNKYRYRAIIIADKNFNIQAYINTVKKSLPKNILNHLKIDIDPYNFY